MQEIQSFNKDFPEIAQIQKIYSSSFFICIQARVPGETKYIYLGRGHGYEGFWLGKKQIPSILRKRDQFLEYIRRYLSGSVLNRIEIDKKDRIIKITYRRFGKANKIMFFYNGRELYFANHYFDEKTNQQKIFRSWVKGNVEYEGDDLAVFDEVGRKEIENKDTLSKYKDISKILVEEKDKALNLVSSGKSKKFLKRKIKNISEDLALVETWPKLEIFVSNHQELDKLEKKTKIESFKFNFKSNEHYKRRDEIYIKIKKLKKAEGILNLRFSDTKMLLSKTSQNEEQFENKLKTVKPVWSIQDNQQVLNTSTEKAYKIFDLGDIKIGVGVSAQGNDQLRKDWAKKTDLWFHLEGDRSPHIILKLNDKVLDEEILNKVAAAMSYFSEGEKTEVRLMYTQVKNIKGVKGSAGKVTVKKDKKVSVQIIDHWNAILSRNAEDIF